MEDKNISVELSGKEYDNIYKGKVDNESELLIVNLADATFVDGTYIVPRIRISKQKEYIPWGDAMNARNSNNYPTKILSLYNNSAIHKNIINIKIHQTVGNGFSFDENDPNAKQTAEFLSKINSDGEDGNELLDKLSNDYHLFNGFASLVTMSRDFTKVTEIKHIEFNNLRCALPDANGDINGYYYAWDWNTSYRPHKIYIPKFDVNDINRKKSDYKKALNDFMTNNKNYENKEILKGLENTFILYYKKFNNDCFFYPIPSYSGCITAIEASIIADQYALNTLKNGMNPLFHLHIPRVLDEESKKRTFRDITASYTGARNTGKPFLTSGKDEQDKPTLTSLPVPDADKRYESVNRNSIQSIVSGHGITNPSLVGISQAGKLGLANELPAFQQLFYIQVIQPAQHQITKQLNKIMAINGLATLSIQSNNPFEDLNLVTGQNNTSGQESGNNNEIVDNPNDANNTDVKTDSNNNLDINN